MSIPRIFILEDEVLTIEALESKLKKNGYLIAGSATSGEDALAQIPRLEPDLVLVDIKLDKGLGELDGIHTAIRLQEVYPVPIVFLTASHDQQHLRRVLDTGIERFVNKPFVDNELIFNIQRALKSGSSTPDPPPKPTTDHLFLHHLNRPKIEQRVNLSEVTYFEGSGKKFMAHTLTGEVYYKTTNIGALLKAYELPDFVQISKKAIAQQAPHHGLPIPADLVHGGASIFISRFYLKSVKRQLGYL
jgi:CheY-like chemotaxis protein